MDLPSAIYCQNDIVQKTSLWISVNCSRSLTLMSFGVQSLGDCNTVEMRNVYTFLEQLLKRNGAQSVCVRLKEALVCISCRQPAWEPQRLSEKKVFV